MIKRVNFVDIPIYINFLNYEYAPILFRYAHCKETNLQSNLNREGFHKQGHEYCIPQMISKIHDLIIDFRNVCLPKLDHVSMFNVASKDFFKQGENRSRSLVVRQNYYSPSCFPSSVQAVSFFP